MTWNGAPATKPKGVYARYIGTAAAVAHGGWTNGVGGFSDTYGYSDLDPTDLFVYSSGTLTFSDSGLYCVRFRVRAGTTATGVFGVRFLLNGSSVAEQVNPGWVDSTTVEVDLPFRPDPGDVVTLSIYNNTSGGNQTTLRTGQTGTMFSVTRLAD